MHGTESQGHSIAPRSRGVAKLSSATAWNSKAEDGHGEAAQGRSGDGMERSCFAEAKRSGTQCAGAWHRIAWYWFYQSQKKGESMKKCSKGIKILAVIYVAVILFIIAATAVEAKDTGPKFRSICTKVNEPDGEWWNGGHLYIIKKGVMQFGWVKWKGRTYYCHYTDSKKYPRGSATRGEMKIKNGKFYAFRGADCRMITEDYYYRYGPVSKRLSLKLNKDK